MENRDIRIYKTVEDLAEAAAELFEKITAQAIQKKGSALVAFSGGSTPHILHQLLARKKDIGWKNIHIFLSDERFVPTTNPDSNWRALNTDLLSSITVPEENLHPPIIESSLELSASQYEKAIRLAAGTNDPVFDLIFLGLGPDGHTASLFPGLYQSREEEPLVLAITNPPKPPAERISFSQKLIQRAEMIIILAAGEEKSPVVEKILKQYDSASTLPAAMAKSKSGSTLWLIDEAAARLLD